MKGKGACMQEVHILHNDYRQSGCQMLTIIMSVINIQYDNSFLHGGECDFGESFASFSRFLMVYLIFIPTFETKYSF